MKKIFKGKRSFEAVGKAEKYLKKLGYSVGSMACDLPIGIKKGNYNIAKWYNLSDSDKLCLDGRMESIDFRDGDVVVIINS